MESILKAGSEALSRFGRLMFRRPDADEGNLPLAKCDICERERHDVVNGTCGPCNLLIL